MIVVYFLMIRRLKIIQVAAGSRLQLIWELRVAARITDTFLQLMILITTLHKKQSKKIPNMIINIFYIILL